MADCAWAPNDGPQTLLLTCPIRDVFFGGARGGGKSDALLGDVLCESKQYGGASNAYLIRRTYPDLEELMDRAGDIYTHVPGKWLKGEKRWKFPCFGGSSVRFRHLDRDDDARHYQGKNMTYCGIDEAPQFATPAAPDMLWGAMRSAKGVRVKMRLTGNPGGPGHEWVQERYIDPVPPMTVQHVETKLGVHKRLFIPSFVTDNTPLLKNNPDYLINLHLVGAPWLVRAWLRGDWHVRPQGVFFDTTKLNYGRPPFINSYYMGIDPATRDADAKDREWKDRDATALVVVGVDSMQRPWIVDVVRRQMDTMQWLQEAIRLHKQYKCRRIWLEGGVIWRSCEPWIRNQLRLQGLVLPFDVVNPGTVGDKAARATPFQTLINAGAVWLPADNAPWLDGFLRELSIFEPTKSKAGQIHDDQVDAASWVFFKILELQASARTEYETPEALSRSHDLERYGRTMVEGGVLSGQAAEAMLSSMDRHDRFEGV